MNDILDSIVNIVVRNYDTNEVYGWFQTIEKPVEDPSELPKWNYDGSSTGQAPGEDSEVIL